MIALFGIFFELMIGIPVGMVSALKQYSIRDRTFTVLSLLFLSMPGFCLGMVLPVLPRLPAADLPAGRLRGLG